MKERWGDRLTRIAAKSFLRIEYAAVLLIESAACGHFSDKVRLWDKTSASQPFLLATNKALFLYSDYLRDYHPEITAKSVDARLLSVVNDELLKWLAKEIDTYRSAGATFSI